MSWAILILQPFYDPIVSAELALCSACLFALYGDELMRQLWHLTPLWGGFHSIKGAIETIPEMKLSAVEEQAQLELDSCSTIQ